ncbi:MAG: LysR family transcriptional regulator [Rhodopseudomonas sp.]|nr:LysR family transcriptional regulator [Rhodopseudomonas sp.]
MINIPTDLLRTFVAVVDMRSFTKAAVSLGVTQPAVSAQIKRLQFLIGDDIFDRSTQGVSLTQHGEVVISYARRLLSLNDQIVHLGGAGPRPELVVRVGTPSDFVASLLPGIMADFRACWPDVRFIVRTDYEEPLTRALHAGGIDILVGLSMRAPHDAHYSWPEDMVWVRGPDTCIDKEAPVPLVSYGEPSVHHKVAVKALKSAGMEWEVVFTGSSMTSLSGAVAAGLGVLAMSRRRAKTAGFTIWEDAPLPKLPDLYRNIYIREGGARAAYEQLADDIAVALDGKRAGSAKTMPSIGLVRENDSAA